MLLLLLLSLLLLYCCIVGVIVYHYHAHTLHKLCINYVIIASFLLLFRTILAAIHFNYNLKREPKVDKQGKPKLKVTYPIKLGEAIVREVRVAQNYGKLKNKSKIKSNLIECIQLPYLT